MDELAARAHIERMTSASSLPELGADEIEGLVESAKRRDGQGRLPTDPEWSPTWDLDESIGRGWRIKAAAAAALHDVNLQGLSFSQSQLYKQCVSQAEAYEQGVAQTDDDVRPRRSGTLVLPPPGWPIGVPYP